MYVELIVWFLIMGWFERADSFSKGGRCGDWVAKAGRGKSSQLRWGVNEVAGVVADMFVEFTWGSAVNTNKHNSHSEWHSVSESLRTPGWASRRRELFCCEATCLSLAVWAARLARSLFLRFLNPLSFVQPSLQHVELCLFRFSDVDDLLVPALF